MPYKVSQTNVIKEIRFFFLFVTYTTIQSITSSEMCSLHLTHPSTHTWSRGQPTLRRPESSRGFGALLKGLTSVMDSSCQSRDSNPQPRVTSPTLYPLGHDCPWTRNKIYAFTHILRSDTDKSVQTGSTKNVSNFLQHM